MRDVTLRDYLTYLIAGVIAPLVAKLARIVREIALYVRYLTQWIKSAAIGQACACN